jgi:hypothetical protein
MEIPRRLPIVPLVPLYPLIIAAVSQAARRDHIRGGHGYTVGSESNQASPVDL